MILVLLGTRFWALGAGYLVYDTRYSMLVPSIDGMDDLVPTCRPEGSVFAGNTGFELIVNALGLIHNHIPWTLVIPC